MPTIAQPNIARQAVVTSEANAWASGGRRSGPQRLNGFSNSPAVVFRGCNRWSRRSRMFTRMPNQPATAMHAQAKNWIIDRRGCCGLTTALELRAPSRQQRIERFHSGLPDHQCIYGALAVTARQLQALVRQQLPDNAL